MQIFGSRVSMFILIKKHSKSDVVKTWKSILIGYTITFNYLKIWAPCSYQVLIASELVVNKSKKEVNLFMEHLLSSSNKPF